MRSTTAIVGTIVDEILIILLTFVTKIVVVVLYAVDEMVTLLKPNRETRYS